MKQLVILSGKGGTGKTTLAGALLYLAKDKAFADCDVDAPNLHLLCGEKEEVSSRDYYGFKKAFKDDALCLKCGLCEEYCKFGAIQNGRVNIYACEGCGVCAYFCTATKTQGKPAVTLRDHSSGELFLSKVKASILKASILKASILKDSILEASGLEGEVFSHAILKMGNGASGKLVTEVRKQLKEEVKKETLAIIDGSPGIGCPVLASITGTDLVLIVTEPSASGLHDLKRIVETVDLFQVPVVVCINKYDLNTDITREIEQYCCEMGIRETGRIPYDPLVSKALNKGESIIMFPESPAAQGIKRIWDKTAKVLGVG